MCLTLSVEVSQQRHEAALIASRYNSINLDINLAGTTSSLGRGISRFSIAEKDEGCACSMLTDNADWNAPTWDIRVEVLPDLALALLFISELASGSFNCQAIWSGEKPVRDVKVSLNELLALVQKNQIGTRTRYIVAAA